MQFFSNTHIDFLGKRRIFYTVSLVITIAGIAAAFIRGVDMGIDVEGGTEAELRCDQQVEIAEVRAAISEAGFVGAEVKSGGENDVLIRVRNQEEADESTGVDSTLAAQLTTAL